MKRDTRFAERLTEMLEALRKTDGVTVTLATIEPPCTDDEIAQVERTLGHRLNDDFLAYYRSANGARVRWESEFAGGMEHLARGGMELRPLAKIFDDPELGYTFGWSDMQPGDAEHPLPDGGIDEFTLRKALRVIDAYPRDGNGYPTVGLFTDGERTDPIVIFPNDACASLDDARPMLATTYLEMLLATCGDADASYNFADRLHGGGRELITWSNEDWSSLGGPRRYLRWLRERGDWRGGSGSKLREQLRMGTKPDAIGPRRWLELRYDLVYPGP